jgi:hypothetical protein
MLGKTNDQLLYDVVKTELYRAFGEKEVASWTVEAVEKDECRVHARGFSLVFYLDTRDETLSSSIIFAGADDLVGERLYIHIISRIIPYFSDYVDAGVKEKNPLTRDVDDIYKILFLVKENRLSPRDIVYFYFGYNSGYTDSPRAS